MSIDTYADDTERCDNCNDTTEDCVCRCVECGDAPEECACPEGPRLPRRLERVTMTRTDPVIIELNCEAKPSTNTVKYDRAEWEAMTPAERAEALDDMVETHMSNAGGGGWYIANEDDEASVGTRPVKYPITDDARDRIARHLHAQSTATIEECQRHADAIIAILKGQQ